MPIALSVAQHLPWILIAISFAALLVFIAYRLVKAKKSGNGTCGCGCSQCAMRDACHAQKPKNKPKTKT